MIRLALAIAILPAEVTAAVPPEAACLLGTWEYVPASSESLVPILERRGTPWTLRSIADSMPHTQTLADDGDHLVFTVHSLVRDAREEMIPDGVPRQETTPKGDTVRLAHAFTSDGSLRTSFEGQLADSRTGTLSITRTCRDEGSRLETLYRLTDADGQTLTALRVYARVRD